VFRRNPIPGRSRGRRGVIRGAQRVQRIGAAGAERGRVLGCEQLLKRAMRAPAGPTVSAVAACATRKIVGWAMDDNYKTPLITRAVKMAARNVRLTEGAVFHSDRGANYTSAEFAGEGTGARRRSAGPAARGVTRPRAVTWQPRLGERDRRVWRQR
jgi:transposase InsO family protein